MRKSIYLVGLATMAALMVTGCQDSYENVADKSNRIYNTNPDPVTTTLLEGEFDEITKTLSVNIAQPVDYDVNITYAAQPEKLVEYNFIYGGAQLLPEANYSMTVTQATIPAGAISSTSAEVTFTGLLDLDNSQIYVLPVSIVSSNVEVLKSRETTFFVFRGASLINVVGNMTGTCMRFVNEGQTPMLSGMREMTFEVLVRPDAFTNTLSTLIGIEGGFLFRIGDAGIPSNQIQLATSSGNVSDSNWALDVNKWTFITITVDLVNREVNCYFNGAKKGSTQSISYSGPINWNVVSSDRACYIGYAYDTNRDFQGDMSQMRVWNRILTTAEINEPNHFYRVSTDAEGLVAYWKFDEGSGNTVHDYANGYDMYVPATYPGKETAPGDIKWNVVSLP